MVMRFECQAGCTACCTQEGWIYLTEDDIARAAAFLGVTRCAFEKRWVYRTRNQRRLRVAQVSGCPFLRESGCSIHPAKPTQCRIFPFWPEIVRSTRGWVRTSRYCPGIGKGRLVRIGSAEALAAEMKAAYPHMYK